MTINAICPGCGAAFQLPDTLKGKKVRCKQCEEIFTPGSRSKAQDNDEKTSRGRLRGSGGTASRTPRIRDEDDYPDDPDGDRAKGSEKTGLLLVIGGAAALVLLLLLSGVGFFLLSGSKDKSTDKSIGSGSTEVANSSLAPGGVADAINKTRSADPPTRLEGANYLASVPLDKNQQVEVARALDPMLRDTDTSIRAGALKAAFVWGTTENVTSLLTLLQGDSQLGNSEHVLAIQALGKIKDERAVEPLVRRMGDFFEGAAARQALQDMGPLAEKEIVKHFNDPDQGIRSNARALLNSYGTSKEILLAQVLEDLKSAEPAHRQGAAEWLALTTVEEKNHVQVALALDPLLQDPDGNVRGSALKAMKTWVTKDNVPSLVFLVSAENDPFGNARSAAIDLLAQLKDERGAVAVASRLPNLFDQAHAIQALQAMGPVAQNEVTKYLGNPDQGVRTVARRILDSYGTTPKVNLDLTQALIDLKSGDQWHKDTAGNNIAKIPMDEAKRAEVLKALEDALTDNDAKTGALKALGTWGNQDSVKLILPFLTENDFFHQDAKKNAIEALGKLKAEQAIPQIAIALTSPGEREVAGKALIALGPVTEPVVATFVGNNDAGTRLEACRVLQEIGSKKSLPILKAHALRDLDLNVRVAATSAIQAITQRN